MSIPNQPRSFADPTVIPCRPGDHRLAATGYADNAIGYEQAWDGPAYLVIGHQAPEDAIERECLRFNLDRFQVMAALASDAGDQP